MELGGVHLILPTSDDPPRIRVGRVEVDGDQLVVMVGAPRPPLPPILSGAVERCAVFADPALSTLCLDASKLALNPESYPPAGWLESHRPHRQPARSLMESC